MIPPRFPLAPSGLPEFQAVADRLREAVHVAYAAYSPSVQEVHKRLMDTEKEQVVQAILYLYDHLMWFEQFREGATLLAYAMPHGIRNDPRIKTAMKLAADLAAAIKDPETERSGYYLTCVHDVLAGFLLDPLGLPARADYLMSIARIRGAKTVLEYGTGSGSNITQSAVLLPTMTWIGVDISDAQIDLNNKKNSQKNVRFHKASEKGIQADVVGLLDCIEHTAYPDDLLTAAERYVRPGGVMVVVAPNGPWSLHYGDTAKNTYAGAGQHIAVQSIQTMGDLLARRGLILDLSASAPSPEGNSSVLATYEPRAGSSCAEVRLGEGDDRR